MSSQAFRWLEQRPLNRTGVRVLQLCIGLALLFRATSEVRHASWLYGPHGIGRGVASWLLGETLGSRIDPLFSSSATPFVLLALQAAGALLLVFGVRTRLGAALALVGLWMLELRTPEISDGGDNLARLLLVYLLLVLPSGAPAPRSGAASIYLHNLGIVLMTGQVVLLYFTAGMAKASGEVWVNGTALYLISQVGEYSLPALRGIFKHPLVSVTASYATVVWQVTFPVGVFSRFKLAFLALGFAFHLGIAVFMGLVTFSLIMIGAELLLITDEEYVWLGGRARAALSAVSQRLRLTRPRAVPVD